MDISPIDPTNPALAEKNTNTFLPLLASVNLGLVQIEYSRELERNFPGAKLLVWIEPVELIL